MANEKELTEARLWCDQARALLKTAKYSKSGTKDLTQRIDKIVAELKALDKGVQSGKFGLDAAAVAAYVERFLAMAGALNSAARMADLAEVDRQSLRMSELKKELALEMATSKRGKKKAQDKLQERAGDNQAVNAYVSARDSAIDRVAALRLHAQADTIDADLLAIETTAIDPAKVEADKGLYPAAMQLLARVAPACDTAERIADDRQVYLDQRQPVQAQLQSGRQHAQAQAAAAEFQQADAKLLAAAALADSPQRDHAGATARLREAGALVAAAKAIGDRCQRALDARVPALAAMVTLGRHAQAAAVQAEVVALGLRLTQGDALADVAQRQYEAAAAEFAAVVAGAQAAGVLADQCQHYLDDRARVDTWVADCGRHVQADAAEAELKQAADQLAAAAAQAAPGTRNYAAALLTLQDAWELGQQANTIASACQTAVAARLPAGRLLTTLNTLRNRFDVVAQQLKVLEPKLQSADAKAAKAVRDYAGATVLYQQIEQAAVAVQAEADKNTWDQSLERATRFLLDALQANSPQRTHLEALWALAHEQAEAGQHGQALKALKQVREVATKALETQPPPAGGKGVQQGTAALDLDAQVSAALADTQAFVGTDLKAVVDLGTAFGSTAPPAWAVESNRIGASLTLDRDAGLDAINAALAQARLDLASHEAAVRKLMTERDAWLAGWAQYQQQRASLAVHAGITGAPALGNRLAASVIAANLAKTSADTLLYGAAKLALDTQLLALTALAKLADASSNFQAVRAQRAGELLATPAGTPPRAVTTRAAGAQCLVAADAAANTGDFIEAMKKLDEMPGHLEQVPRLNKANQDYAALLNGWGAQFVNWQLDPVKYKSHLSDELARASSILATAKTAKDGGDIFLAATVISGIGTLGAATQSTRSAVIAYVDKRGPFDIEFQKVEVHAGRDGIEPFYLRAKAERDFANATLAKREFAAAMQIIDKVKPQIAPQLLVAARFVIYEAKKTDTRNKIDLIRPLDTAGLAAAELASCDRYLTLADQQQQAATAQAAVGPLDAATTALDTALAHANAAKALLDKVQALQALKPAAAGSAANTLQARINAFAAMKQHVKAQAGDASFDSLLNSTDALVQQATTALAETPANTAAAGVALDQADRILADALQKIARKPAYTSALAAVELAANTTLPGLNVPPNKCLDDELAKVKDLLTQAKDKAKPPALDYAQAGTLLAEARVLAGRATEKHAVFASLRPDRQIIKNLATHLDGAAYQPALARERDRVKAIDTEIDRQLAAFAYPAARKLAADGKALKVPYEKLCTDYTAVVTLRTQRFADADSTVAGKPHLKIEDDEYKLLRPQVDKMIDVDHAFAAATKLLLRIAYLSFFAGVEGPDYKLYTDARKVQADRLATLKPGNDGVKDLIAQVEAALQRGDLLAGRREYVQAKDLLKTLPPLLDAIARDTPLYAAWALARDAALLKFEAASRHAQVDVILPLLAMVDTQRKQAEEMATRREFVAAETLAKEIPANCDAAVLAANAYTQFDALAGGAGAANAQALQDAINALDIKIKALQTAPPHEQLPGAISTARTQKDAAQTALTGGDTAAAASAIRDASAACGKAEIHKLQFVQVKQQIAAALKLVDDFTAGPHTAKAFVAARMAATRELIDGALQVMVAGGSEAATKVLVAATDTFRADALLADRRAAYDAQRLTLEPSGALSALAKLEQHAHRYAAADDIEVLRTQLAEAATAAAAAQPDFDKAMAALKKASQAAAAARLALAMLDTATPPTAADIASVLEQSGGDKKIDAMVMRLDPKQRRAVMQQVFQVRFGCKLDIYKDAGLDTADPKIGPDVMRFYKNFAKLPAQHALKNDNLLVLDDKLNAAGTAGAAGSSDFAGWYRKITMRDGNAATSAGRDLGAKHALGDNVPDACKPANDDPVLFFDWNTLHEAGHAVEDKYRFMATRQGDAAYGGWTDYGMDMRRVAEKLVTEFGYDLSYTQELLSGVAEPALPDPAGGEAFDLWERRRVRLKLWVDNAQSAKNPWETDATAQALKLQTGEIIHEAYGGQWYGYLASERSKGITGYQFRSPVEWFSEIYAAYYSKKLKPAHPATSWLATLETAEKT